MEESSPNDSLVLVSDDTTEERDSPFSLPSYQEPPTIITNSDLRVGLEEALASLDADVPNPLQPTQENFPNLTAVKDKKRARSPSGQKPPKSRRQRRREKQGKESSPLSSPS